MNYRPEIDGLRAVAVAPVILFHAGVPAFSGGFVGVDVFFVISGYLITSILIDDLQNDRFSIGRFYERRARRILPALFVVLAATTAAGWFWMTPAQLEEYSRALVSVLSFASNIYFWRVDDYFAPATDLNPLLHTWSLAVEEQFYILFPLLLFVAWRMGRRGLLWGAVGLSLASLALAQWGAANAPTANFFLLPTRAWELGAGAICALLLSGSRPRPNGLLSATGLGLILVSVFAYDAATPFPSLYALAPVGGTALVILYGGAGTLTGRILSLRAVVGIGLVSYSAYLWHQPLFAFARLLSLTHPSIWLMLSLALASFALAYLTWRFVENPFRRPTGTPLTTRARVFVASGLAAACFAALGLGGIATDGRQAIWSPPSPAAGVVYDLHQAAMEVDGLLMDDGACRFNVERLDPETVDRIRSCSRRFGPGLAIVGDSHAMDLFNGVYAVGADPFVFGLTYWKCQFGRIERDCDLDRLDELIRRNPDAFGTVVYHIAGQRLLKSPDGGSARDYLSGIPEYGSVRERRIRISDARIAREMQELAKFGGGTDVIWLGPRIEPHIGLNYMLKGGCDHSYALRDGQADLFDGLDHRLEAAARDAGVGYVSLIDAVGFDMSSDFMTCDRLYWRDSNHWSADGARRFVGRLLDRWPDSEGVHGERETGRLATDADHTPM